MIRTIIPAIALAFTLVLVGCNEPHARLNAPPHGKAEKTSDMQGTFVYMNDNALLANMTVNDSHFLPHRARLNGLGIERLSRLASLIEAYGGTVRFDTRNDDETLNKKRLAAIREFLAETGVDTTSDDVVVMDISGGEGMNAGEAIAIRAKEGSYQPDKKSSGLGNGSDSPKDPPK